jgi:hypothetical protein
LAADHSQQVHDEPIHHLRVQRRVPRVAAPKPSHRQFVVALRIRVAFGGGGGVGLAFGAFGFLLLFAL